MWKREEKGAVTLEACISVLAFLVLMLLLSSLFVMFMAQNLTAHAVLQTSQSLSMENYTIQKMMLEDGKIGSTSNYLAQFVRNRFGNDEKNPGFVASSHWSDGKSEEIAQVVRNRFIGFLAGGADVNGEKEADQYLKSLNVVNGLKGLDFSGSYVEDDMLYIVLRYQLEYDFNIWDVGIVDVEQTTCSKLW